MKKLLPVFVIFVLPALFALLLPSFFRLQVFTDPQQLVSMLGMILLPFLGGALVVSVSSLSSSKKPTYRVFMPWLPILVFFAITFAFQLEDCACWTIGLPLYLLFSSLGGILAGYLKSKNAALAPVSPPTEQ